MTVGSRGGLQTNGPAATTAIALVAPDTLGDPMSPLRSTTKSLAKLSKGLALHGFKASTRTASRLLARAGCRLQAVFRPRKATSIPTGMPSSVTSTPPPRSFWPPGTW
jgi:hypothetical protein